MRTLYTIIGLLLFNISNTQPLETLVKEALANSPEIQKFEFQYKIALEKINEVNTIPNTEFGVGYFVSEPETRTGAQRFKISLKQMIPWFGTLTSRVQYVSSLADAKYVDIAIAKRKLVASVSQSYYNLYALKSKQRVITLNIDLLKTYEVSVLTAVETGKASAVDALKLQMRQNELKQLIKVLENNFLAEQSSFNNLLNRDKAIEVRVADELTIVDEGAVVNPESLTLHPELVKYDKLFQSVEQSELLNQKNGRPKFGFGVDYIVVSERSGLTFNDNGKDILMPMASVSIPIFNRRYRSISKQNELKLQEINAQKQERLNKLQVLLDKAVNKRASAKISYDTQTENLKQAKYAEEILIKGYESGTVNFNDVLEIQELQLKSQINQIEAVNNYYMQTMIIQYLSN